jgi:hypothetical protein
MKRFLRGLVALILTTAAVSGTAQAQGFTGSVVGVQSGPDEFGPFNPNMNFTATSDATELSATLPRGIAFFDISASRITFGLNPGTTTLSFASGGYLFSDINNTIANLSSATLVGGTVTNPGRVILLHGNAIFLNLAGITATADPTQRVSIAEIEVGFASSVVPEPATYALMATGLIGLAGIARMKRRPMR